MAKSRAKKTSRRSKPAAVLKTVRPLRTRHVGPMPNQDASLGNIPISQALLQDVHPDTVDFRDLMYVPTLIEVPVRRTLREYLEGFKHSEPAAEGPVLNQGHEGACTGFGLAGVANYLLSRRRIVPDNQRVSPRM